MLNDFYARVKEWWSYEDQWQQTGDVYWLRKQCNPDGKSHQPLLDHLEFMIFNATLRRGIELNVDEAAWLDSSDRNSIQITEIS